MCKWMLQQVDVTASGCYSKWMLQQVDVTATDTSKNNGSQATEDVTNIQKTPIKNSKR